MKKNKMKKLLSLFLISSVILVLTACGGESKDGEKASGDDVEIRLLTRMAGTTTQVDIFKDILADFEAEYDDVVIIDDSQGDEGSFNNILKTNRASGDLPNIYRVQGVANLEEYIENDLVMDMEPVFAEDTEWSDGFIEGARNYYQVPGFEGIYGVPMESGIIGIYYNEKLLAEAGFDEFPETWSDFKAAIESLNEMGVIPLSLGAKSNSAAGHLHNLISYRWLGTDVAKELGAGELDWDSPEMIETFEFVEELRDINAWDPNAAGIDGDVALASVQNGEAAMIITGPWNGPSLTDEEESKEAENIRMAKFPYFEEKPEFKDHDMQVISPYMVNGKLEGKEKEYTIELVKRLTNAENAKRYAEEAGFMVPRTDVDINEDEVQSIFLENLELSRTSEALGVDMFDYHPEQFMQDRTRNSIVSIITGASAEDAANEIQSELDERRAE